MERHKDYRNGAIPALGEDTQLRLQPEITSKSRRCDECRNILRLQAMTRRIEGDNLEPRFQVGGYSSRISSTSSGTVRMHPRTWRLPLQCTSSTPTVLHAPASREENYFDTELAKRTHRQKLPMDCHIPEDDRSASISGW